MSNGNLNKFDPLDENDILEIERIKKIIKNAIKKIDLDLTGLTVLTEAATGHWIFTPFIAAMANASSVICITKNSQYGNSDEIIQNFSNLKKYFGFIDIIEIHDKINEQIIGKADLVTNSGHVRPINEKFIEGMKDTAVISLMWEPWEYRESDLDLSYCIKKNICVLGVNEDNAILNIMKYVENLIIKICENIKLELKNKKIIVIAENKSAHYMISPLNALSKSVYFVSKTIATELKNRGANVIGISLDDPLIESYLKDVDIIIINSHPVKLNVIGHDGLEISRLKKIAPNVQILAFFGSVDYQKLEKNKIPCYPKSAPSNEHMEWNLDILDSKPTIELCALGFKSVESLAKDRKLGIDVKTAISDATKSPFCLDFSKEQKKKYMQ